MDVRLTSEQRQLRDAAAKLADDLGPGSVAELDDEKRRARLERAVDVAGWRALRTDGASGVEVAIVAEEFGRRLIDVAFLGPVLADDLYGKPAEDGDTWTIDWNADSVAPGLAEGPLSYSTLAPQPAARAATTWTPAATAPRTGRPATRRGPSTEGMHTPSMR